jgi:hypothetical protein
MKKDQDSIVIRKGWVIEENKRSAAFHNFYYAKFCGL